MATPEFIAMQCDHCPLKIGPRGTLVVYDQPKMFENHSEAYREAKKLGWYIADMELCPTCAEAYVVEKAGEEVFTWELTPSLVNRPLFRDLAPGERFWHLWILHQKAHDKSNSELYGSAYVVDCTYDDATRTAVLIKDIVNIPLDAEVVREEVPQ